MTKSTPRELEEEIDYLKRKLKVSSDLELSGMLQLSPSSISAWRRRLKLPRKYELMIEDFIAGGPSLRSGNFGVQREGYAYGLLAFAAVKLHSQFEGVENLNHFMWYGFRLEKLHRYLVQEFEKVKLGDTEGLMTCFTALKTSLERPDLFEWLEALPTGKYVVAQ